MSILCGTDFSESAQSAIRVAVQLARRYDGELHLMHAIQLSPEELRAEPKSELVSWAERQLERAAARVGGEGIRVTTHLRPGAPDEALLALAAELRSQMIVVGALGHRARGTWRLGSHSDRLAQRADLPVLVVRQAEGFEAWLEGKRALRVVLGADLSHSTDVAMAMLEKLRKLSPCDVTAVHLYWPPAQFERLGLVGVRSYIDPDPDVTKTLVRDLTQRLAPNDPGSIRIRTEPHLGRPGDRLAAIATEETADLLVVGSHDRSALGRIWEGSVSRWALHAADVSVLCVPPQTEAAPVGAPVPRPPRVRNVLAATDFSPSGNAAVAMAYAVAEPGAIVHVVHVVPLRNPTSLAPHDVFSLEREPNEDPRTVETHVALTALIPRDIQQVTRLYALESNQPGSAICQAAVRVAADVICLGHRGRSGLASALLGSVSKDVLAHAEKPVLLTHQPSE